MQQTRLVLLLLLGVGMVGLALPLEPPTLDEIVPAVKVQRRQIPASTSLSGKPTAAPIPPEALVMALADVRMAPIPFHRYIRWLWLPDGQINGESQKVGAFVLNLISRGSVIVKPLSVMGGKLLRIDLRWYAPRDTDLQEWIDTWELLAFDPTFSLLLTKDTLGNIDRTRLPKIKRTVTRIIKGTPETIRKESREVHHNGGEFHYPDDSKRVVKQADAGLYRVDLEFIERGRPDQIITEVIEEQQTGDVLRVNRIDCDEAGLTILQEACNTLAPIVHIDYFITRVVTTIQDDNKEDETFKTVWGGLYYQFRGIKRSDVKGVTDEDLFFQSLAIGSKGENAKQLFDRVRGDQRVAVFRSGVTGKPRRVDLFQTPATREGSSWGAISHDLKDRDIGPGRSPIANLLDFKDRAREGIFPGTTGMPIFTMFDGEGKLQDEVPFDVALDRTTPGNSNQRLNVIGCIRCHGPHDGWQPLTNDVTKLTAGRPDIFGDLAAGRNAFSPDTIDRLTGLYAGSFAKHLRRARDDYAEAVLRCTGPWRTSKDQTDVAQLVSKRLSDGHAAYWHEEVDTHKACKELGVECDKSNATDVLLLLLPPDIRADRGGFIAEDFRITALLSGVSISRTDWALIQGFAAERSRHNRDILLREK